MRRILLGVMVGSLSLPLYSATDGSAYDFLIQSRDLSSRELMEAERELKEAMAARNGEKAFSNYLASTVRARMASKKTWETNYTDAQLKAIEMAGVSLSDSFASGASVAQLTEELAKTEQTYEKLERRIETLSSELETAKRELKVKEQLPVDLRNKQENRQAIFELQSRVRMVEQELNTEKPRLDQLRTSKEALVKNLRVRRSFENGEAVDLEAARNTFSVGEGIPFRVVQSLQVVKGRGNRVDLVAVFEIELDDSIPRSSWPPSLKKRFENVSDAEIEEFLKEEVNKELKTHHYRIGDLKDFKRDDVRGKIMSNLRQEIANFASNKIFGASDSAALKQILARKTDSLGAGDEAAKLKIAQAVRRSPQLLKKEEPCEALLAILGKEGFAKLSPESKMECESFIEEKRAKEAEAAKAKEIESAAKEQDMQRAAQIGDGLEGLRAHCAQLKQEAAMRQKQVEQQIAPLFLALSAVDAQSFKCEMLGALDGDLATGDSSNALLAELSKNNPFLASSSLNPEVIAEKAQRVAASAPKSLEGLKKLESQHKCIAESLGLAGATIAAMQTFGQQWAQLHPEEYRKRLAQAEKVHKMARALTEAISEELAVRGAGGTSMIRSMSSADAGSGGPAAQVKALGSSGGVGTPVRIRKSVDTNVERGLAPGTGTTTRRNSGAGAGAPGNLPPPNFLGE
jgi:hypothetical protein